MNEPPKNIDEYIAGFPEPTQKKLNEVRSAIHSAAPEATEKISYAIPTFILHGTLVHFAAFKNHIGFYALPSGNAKFQEELSVYEVGRGSVRFPLDKPLPLDLIKKIVKFRIEENIAKTKTRA